MHRKSADVWMEVMVPRQRQSQSTYATAKKSNKANLCKKASRNEVTASDSKHPARATTIDQGKRKRIGWYSASNKINSVVRPSWRIDTIVAAYGA